MKKLKEIFSDSYWIGFFAGIPAFLIGFLGFLWVLSKIVVKKYGEFSSQNPIPDTKPRAK